MFGLFIKLEENKWYHTLKQESNFALKNSEAYKMHTFICGKSKLTLTDKPNECTENGSERNLTLKLEYSFSFKEKAKNAALAHRR